MAQVSVSINGKIYRMACGEGEEDRLLGLAQTFETYVTNLKTTFGEIGDQRLTVMAGIMVVDELSEARRQVDLLQAELDGIRKQGAAADAGHRAEREQLAARLTEAAAKIERLALVLTTGKAEQAGGH